MSPPHHQPPGAAASDPLLKPPFVSTATLQQPSHSAPALPSQDSDTPPGSTLGSRKRYVLTKRREYWTPAEHARFLAALKCHGRDWKAIEAAVGTRSRASIRSHAQKFVLKLERNRAVNELACIPPPRRRKARAIGAAAADDESDAHAAATAASLADIPHDALTVRDAAQPKIKAPVIAMGLPPVAPAVSHRLEPANPTLSQLVFPRTPLPVHQALPTAPLRSLRIPMPLPPLPRPVCRNDAERASAPTSVGGKPPKQPHLPYPTGLACNGKCGEHFCARCRSGAISGSGSGSGSATPSGPTSLNGSGSGSGSGSGGFEQTRRLNLEHALRPPRIGPLQFAGLKSPKDAMLPHPAYPFASVPRLHSAGQNTAHGTLSQHQPHHRQHQRQLHHQHQHHPEAAYYSLYTGQFPRRPLIHPYYYQPQVHVSGDGSPHQQLSFNGGSAFSNQPGQTGPLEKAVSHIQLPENSNEPAKPVVTGTTVGERGSVSAAEERSGKALTVESLPDAHASVTSVRQTSAKQCVSYAVRSISLPRSFPRKRGRHDESRVEDADEAEGPKRTKSRATSGPGSGLTLSPVHAPTGHKQNPVDAGSSGTGLDTSDDGSVSAANKSDDINRNPISRRFPVLPHPTPEVMGEPEACRSSGHSTPPFSSGDEADLESGESGLAESMIRRAHKTRTAVASNSEQIPPAAHEFDSDLSMARKILSLWNAGPSQSMNVSDNILQQKLPETAGAGCT